MIRNDSLMFAYGIDDTYGFSSCQRFLQVVAVELGDVGIASHVVGSSPAILSLHDDTHSHAEIE